MPYDPYGADEHRDSRYMDDDEYEYHGDAADDETGKRDCHGKLCCPSLHFRSWF